MVALTKIREHIKKLPFLHMMRSLFVNNDFCQIKEPLIQIEILDIIQISQFEQLLESLIKIKRKHEKSEILDTRVYE